MNCFELMIAEHVQIKRALTVIRRMCSQLLNGVDVPLADFTQVIDFVRTYADKHHHGKEEALLFKHMTDELGPLAEKLIKQGMLVEHTLGRSYMYDLEIALQQYQDGDQDARLDIIANSISYANLLNRHIDREDHGVYTFAQKKLAQETLDRLEQECQEFELRAHEQAIQEHYATLLTELEQIYQI